MDANESTLSQKINNLPSFTLYGNNFKSVPGSDLSFDEDVVARVELSGSEGFYIEVVKYHYGQAKWCRYAFHKVFNQTDADEICSSINRNSSLSPIFKKLPNYPID